MTNKDKAKRVIAEIVRQSAGDRLRGKTRLFKAFYFAHLYYAKTNVDYLTDWPIVRMPNGPGIDKFSTLLKELMEEGIIQVRDELEGPYPTTAYEFLPSDWDPLPREDMAAIREAVMYVQPRSAGNLSGLTHDSSRSWNAARDGEELNIYLDLLTDEEYEESSRRNQELTAAMDQIWNG